MSSPQMKCTENETDDELTYVDRSGTEIEAPICISDSTSPEIIVEKGSMLDCSAEAILRSFYLCSCCNWIISNSLNLIIDPIGQKMEIFSLMITVFYKHILLYDSIINGPSEMILKSILFNIFVVANKLRMKSISIPVLGKLYGYPPDVLAKIFAETIKFYMSRPFKQNDTIETIRIIVDSEDQNLIDGFNRYFRKMNMEKCFSNNNYELFSLKQYSEEFLKVKSYF